MSIACVLEIACKAIWVTVAPIAVKSCDVIDVPEILANFRLLSQANKTHVSSNLVEVNPAFSLLSICTRVLIEGVNDLPLNDIIADCVLAEGVFTVYETNILFVSSTCVVTLSTVVIPVSISTILPLTSTWLPS